MDMSIPTPWEAVAEGYTRTVTETTSAFAARAIDLADLAPTARVLDVATGPATVPLLLADRVAHVTGVDFAHAMIRIARSRTAHLDHVTIQQGDGQDLPFQAAFDAAFSLFGLMFFPDRAAGLASLHRALVPGGVAIIKVGAATEIEMKEKKARVEDALNATRAAAEMGIVPGGGVALIRAQAALADVNVEGELRFGVDIIREACEAPLRGIASNAGADASIVIHKVRDADASHGWNAASDTWGDMFEMGVIDPTKVTLTALSNAASVSGLLLTTEAMIAEKDDEEYLD